MTARILKSIHLRGKTAHTTGGFHATPSIRSTAALRFTTIFGTRPHEGKSMRLRLLTIFLTAILLSLAVSGPVLAADTLPTSIPDQAFWKMISDFSEPGGSFDFEMYMSNEVTFQTILPELLSRVPTGGVYLGVAPEQNFTYIAALRPKIAFIIDIRREKPGRAPDVQSDV